MTIERLPKSAVGLRLYRIDKRDRLLACEAMRFPNGWAGVETVLRRARISGRVAVEGNVKNHFADALNDDGDMVATVALDARSYSALKNKWMRCKLEPVSP